MTPTTGYRFTVPDSSTACASRSFGIEPYGVNSKGKAVKTGKASIRIVMWNDYSYSRDVAHRTALAISDHLNKGGTYVGPKIIHVDCVFSMEKLEGWLK